MGKSKDSPCAGETWERKRDHTRVTVDKVGKTTVTFTTLPMLSVYDQWLETFLRNYRRLATDGEK